MNLMQTVEKKQLTALKKNHKKEDLPNFSVGDTIKVYVKVKEASKEGKERERLQAFEGIVISRKGGGLNEMFIVRKISNGVGVERIFPLNTPVIDKIKVIRKGKVRKAKLYYLRDRVGKSTKVKGVEN